MAKKNKSGKKESAKKVSGKRADQRRLVQVIRINQLNHLSQVNQNQNLNQPNQNTKKREEGNQVHPTDIIQSNQPFPITIWKR